MGDRSGFGPFIHALSEMRRMNGKPCSFGPATDPVAMAEALGRYVEDPGLRESHARAARARAEPKVAPSPGEARRSFRHMLDRLTPKVPEGGTLDLVTDDHPDYRREVRRRRRGMPIRHRVYRNPPDRRRGDPPTPETVARDRAMFPVDVLHKWFRHVDADHRRESIAFCRRGEAVLERLSAVVVGRNLIQRVSERRNDARTPGMLIGLTSRPWTWGEVLARRRWPERIGMDATTRRVVERSMRDPLGIEWPRHVRRRSL